MASTISASTTSATALNFASDTTGVLALQTGSTPTTAVTIDGSQNVGIGTSSPTSKLDVAGNIYMTAGDTLRFKNSASNASYIRAEQNSSSAAYTYATMDGRNTGFWSFSTNDTERMRIDSSGNVGIGTTPSSWSTLLGFQVQTTSVASFSNTAYFSSNAYYNGGYKYINTAYASQYIQTNGTHQWFTAPSGTAGNAITFSESMRIDSSGNVLVGTTSNPTTNRINVSWNNASVGGMRFSPSSTSYNQSAIEFYDAGSTRVGYIYSTGVATVYSTTSDYRLKENVAPMAGALDKVSALKPVTYQWKADGSYNQGFIAHELQAVVPECVIGEKDAVDAEGKPIYQGIDTSFLVATLTAAIQEQQALIENLTTRLAALEGTK